MGAVGTGAFFLLRHYPIFVYRKALRKKLAEPELKVLQIAFNISDESVVRIHHSFLSENLLKGIGFFTTGCVSLYWNMAIEWELEKGAEQPNEEVAAEAN